MIEVLFVNNKKVKGVWLFDKDTEGIDLQEEERSLWECKASFPDGPLPFLYDMDWHVGFIHSKYAGDKVWKSVNMDVFYEGKIVGEALGNDLILETFGKLSSNAFVVYSGRIEVVDQCYDIRDASLYTTVMFGSPIHIIYTDEMYICMDDLVDKFMIGYDAIMRNRLVAKTVYVYKKRAFVAYSWLKETLLLSLCASIVLRDINKKIIDNEFQIKLL